MTIVVSRGCTSSGVSVDDENLWEMEETQQREVLDHLIKGLVNENGVGTLIAQLVIEFATDSVYDDEPCEQCGDTYEEYIWEEYDE